MSPRETIFAALFTLASSGAQWKTKSRRLKHWADVAPADQPALFMSQGNQNARFTMNTPTIWTFDVEFYIYAHTGGDELTSPATIINPLLDQLVTNLLPLPLTGEQTLGNLVTLCRIDGDLITDEGVLGDQAVAIIPVKLLLPQ